MTLGHGRLVRQARMSSYLFGLVVDGYDRLIRIGGVIAGAVGAPETVAHTPAPVIVVDVAALIDEVVVVPVCAASAAAAIIGHI